MCWTYTPCRDWIYICRVRLPLMLNYQLYTVTCVNPPSYIWIKPKNYHDKYFRWSVAAWSLFMLVSFPVEEDRSLPLFVGSFIFLLPSLRICVTTFHYNRDSSPMAVSLPVVLLKSVVQSCTNPKGQLCFILHILVRCCACCYLFHSHAKYINMLN